MTLLRWLTFLLISLNVILTALLFWDFFLSSDASICSKMAFPQLGHFYHVVVSVSIGFPSSSKRDALFHRITYDYSRTDWDGLCGYLRDVTWKDIFKLSASASASECYECFQVRIVVYIPHRECQVKPRSSPWLSCACAAAIAHRNRFCLHQQNKSSESEIKFRQTHNYYKSCQTYIY